MMVLPIKYEEKYIENDSFTYQSNTVQSGVLLHGRHAQ